MKASRYFKTISAAATLLLAGWCHTAPAGTILDNLVPPTFNTAAGGDQVGAAIHIGSTPVAISTIEFASFFTGGYVYRPGQTFAIYSRNANGTVGVPLFTDFTMTPGNNQNPRTIVTANSAYVLQANTGYWLVLSKPPDGLFVLWNFTNSTSYASDFGVSIPVQRASFYSEEGENFYFDLQEGPQSLRVLGDAVTAPVATSVVSRKQHGAATFDIDLPLTGRGVEGRTPAAGGNHTLVFAFNNDIATATANVTSGTGAVLGSPAISGNTVTVELTGVANQQTITVSLSNVSDMFGQMAAPLHVQVGFLMGDTSGDGFINAVDISQTKSFSGAAATAANFRSDVDTSGTVNAVDISIVKSRSGDTVPTAAERARAAR